MNRFFFSKVVNLLDDLPLVDTTDKALSHTATAAVDLQPKVGDKVQRKVEEESFYRIRSVTNKGVFTTDPNSPFEHSWKGLSNQYQPHPTYPGYWVPKSAGIVQAQKKHVNRIASHVYEVTVDWHGQEHKCRVKAKSINSLFPVVAEVLSKTTLPTYTAWSIRDYLTAEENKAKVLVRQV